MEDVDRCPVCDEEYVTAYFADGDESRNIGRKMYTTRTVCHEQRSSGMMVYLHGERL